jgi:hypothetical protein
MTPLELIAAVERDGGELTLEDDRVRYRLPSSAAPILSELRAHRDGVKAELKRERTLERPACYSESDWCEKPHDYYEWRARAALDALCRIPAREGLIVWLGEYSSDLCEKLTCNLPNEISRGWNAQISFKEFDVLCSRLVDTFRTAAELYRNSKRTPQLMEQPEKPNPGRNFLE